MFDLVLLLSRLDSFPPEYKNNYDKFYRWEVKVESKNGNSILDSNHISQTYIPRQLYAPMWQELARAKEADVQTNDYGSYAIIAMCKPLLFLWRQTLVFDNKVRGNLPDRYRVNKYSRRWTVNEWMRVMSIISKDLNQDPETVEFIENKSVEGYGKDAAVPYAIVRYLLL